VKKTSFFLVVSFFFLSCLIPVSAGETSKANYSAVSAKNSKPKIKDSKLRTEINRWIGAPYRAGGTSPKGTDCSGFVYSVYKKVYGVDLPRRSRDMYKVVSKKKKQKKLKEGDLVFFRTVGPRISHVGIYISDGYFVHASSSRGVVWSNLDEDYYRKNFAKGGEVDK